MEFTTIDTLKRYLNIAFDDYSENEELLRLIRSVSESIIGELNTDFTAGTYTDYIEGLGKQFIYPANRPVNAILSVTENDSLLDASDYIFFVKENSVYKEAGWKDGRFAVPGLVGDAPDNTMYQKNITVVYTAGYILPGDVGRTLPYDIEEACLAWCESRRDHSNMAKGIKQEAIGDYSVTYFDPNITYDDMPTITKGILSKYMVWPI